MRDEIQVQHNMCVQLGSDGVDALIAELAGRQHGVVARWQLEDAGVSRRSIEHRLHCRRLHSLHRGVYAVGHRVVSQRGRWMAAVLAAGRGAVLSHRSAAALWRMRPHSGGRIDVSAAHNLARRPGLQPHRLPLPSDEVTIHDGIPVTTVPRTLLDLAAVIDKRALAKALEQAEILRLTDPLSPATVLERHPRRRGAAKLRAALNTPPLPQTRSELEHIFLEALAKARLPRPETNALVGTATARYEVDCLWREQRLIVELDGRSTHDTAAAFERDRARDRDLSARGFRVVRITSRQLAQERRAVMRDLRTLTACA
jgi:very-short-patch-repair endonuclease